MPTEKLRVKVKKGLDITEAELNEMYAVRAHFMDLKPHVPREKDFQFFKQTVEAAGKVFLFITASGSIKGLYTVDQFIERCTITGKKRLIVEPEFGFVLEEYQGKYMSKTVQRNAIMSLLQYPFIPKFLLGPAYPASYFTLKKYGKHVYTWLDKDLPADVKDVLMMYAQRHEMIENGIFTGIKSLNTLPKNIKKEHIERLEKNKDYSLYLSQNPHWQQGYGLVTLTKMTVGTFLYQLKNKWQGK